MEVIDDGNGINLNRISVIKIKYRMSTKSKAHEIKEER